MKKKKGGNMHHLCEDCIRKGNETEVEKLSEESSILRIIATTSLVGGLVGGAMGGLVAVPASMILGGIYGYFSAVVCSECGANENEKNIFRIMEKDEENGFYKNYSVVQSDYEHYDGEDEEGVLYYVYDSDQNIITPVYESDEMANVSPEKDSDEETNSVDNEAGTQDVDDNSLSDGGINDGSDMSDSSGDGGGDSSGDGDSSGGGEGEWKK